MKDKLKDYYIKNFNDELGQQIDSNSTFLDLSRAINNKEDVYSVIGVESIVIRKRLFERLAVLTNSCYREVYHLWING